MNIFDEVRFKESQPKSKEPEWLKANRVLPNGLIIRHCQFKYYLRKMGEFDYPNILPLDRRHKLLGDIA